MIRILSSRSVFGKLAFLAAASMAVPLGGCATSTHLGSSDLKRIPGRTYVIVGASSGFGKGVALRLGKERANVVLAARRTELLEQIATDIRTAGGNPLVVTTDVSKAEDVDALAKAAVGRFGRIDVWMNVAGVGAIGRFWEIPVQDYSRLIDTNVKGVIYGSHAALLQFIAQGQGTLVNVGSVDSEVPLAYQSVYAASKASVLSLARSVNQESVMPAMPGRSRSRRSCRGRPTRRGGRTRRTIAATRRGWR
jgi:NADP-dependent 3-hydroxy acid dehydrogenase YdfG